MNKKGTKKKITLVVKMLVRGDMENIDEYKSALKNLNVVEDLGSDSYDLEVVKQNFTVK